MGKRELGEKALGEGRSLEKRWQMLGKRAELLGKKAKLLGKRVELLGVVLALCIGVSACSKKDNLIESSVSLESEEVYLEGGYRDYKDIDLEKYKNDMIEKFQLIKYGEMYRVVDVGIRSEFHIRMNEVHFNELKDIIKNSSFALVDSGREDIVKYIVNLYAEDGDEVASLAVWEDGEARMAHDELEVKFENSDKLVKWLEIYEKGA